MYMYVCVRVQVGQQSNRKCHGTSKLDSGTNENIATRVHWLTARAKTRLKNRDKLVNSTSIKRESMHVSRSANDSISTQAS